MVNPCDGYSYLVTPLADRLILTITGVTCDKHMATLHTPVGIHNSVHFWFSTPEIGMCFRPFPVSISSFLSTGPLKHLSVEVLVI